MSEERDRGQQTAHEYKRVRVQTGRPRYDRPLFAEILDNNIKEKRS